MAITTYSELQAAIGRWLKRTNLADVAPDLILLAEARLSRRLRLRQMREYWAVTPSQPHTLLPGGYNEAIRVMYGGQRMDFVPETMADPAMNRGGERNQYTIAGNKLWLLTHVDGRKRLELHYYQALERLSDNNISNWLLQDAPDVYLYAALLEAEPYIKNDERILIWREALGAAIEDLHSADGRGQHSGSALAMRNA